MRALRFQEICGTFSSIFKKRGVFLRMSRNPSILFKKGTLWDKLTKATEHALSIGALLQIPTGHEYVQDRGVAFFVRSLTSLSLKDGTEKTARGKRTGQTRGPLSSLRERPFRGGCFRESSGDPE